MKNIMTVDLEDWFSVEVLKNVITREQWEYQRSVVEENTYELLKVFSEYDIKATFFVLGWIADRYPALIKDVAAAGHEIACHSYAHRMVSSLTPEEFREDTKRALEAIFKACGQVPIGYRSPTWGVKSDMLWAFEILGELGFKYDSSIYRARHDIYGQFLARLKVFFIPLLSGVEITEFSPSAVEVLFRRRISIGGGGWLRQLPYWFTKWGIRKLNRRCIPTMIYFHPWELDPDLPGKNFIHSDIRRKIGMKAWIKHYGNLITMETKIKKLLEDFDFTTIKEFIETTDLKPSEMEK